MILFQPDKKGTLHKKNPNDLLVSESADLQA